MKASVIIFPGSNCDHDIVHALRTVCNATVQEVWHQDSDLKQPDLVVLPGGFSYGDYLRTGALAKLSPAMRSVKTYAESGGRVLGICNGFQILCEAGMLPGVLLQNVRMKFLSRFVSLRAENNKSFFTSNIPKQQLFTCPIAHGDGNFFAESDTLKKIEDNQQVVFRYVSSEGEVSEESEAINPNGSAHSIAGVCNEKGNVIGLMPHPERSIEKSVGGIGGDSCRVLFSKLL